MLFYSVFKPSTERRCLKRVRVFNPEGPLGSYLRDVILPSIMITCQFLCRTRAVVGQRSSPAGYILYCNIFIIKPYNIGHTDLDVFVCKSFCHIDIIIQV